MYSPLVVKLGCNFSVVSTTSATDFVDNHCFVGTVTMFDGFFVAILTPWHSISDVSEVKI